MAVPSVTASEAITLSEGGTWLLDVREQDEWDRGHAPSAHLVPLSELGARLAEVPTDQQVLVVCLSGGRSQRAATALAQSGVDAVNVSGGMLAWSAADGPLVSEGTDAARVE
ncbi:rhodanese-like domain-containing protein [Lacisediminihabitans sp. H27-G8]|uniref:rhodanese-like domain-containing protein n=1 Tax=Lacisediminihabitans sp. H27-G8 TaxID=3111909 RepID=UPI0038FC30CB